MRSLVVASAGSGAQPRPGFRAETEAVAAGFREDGPGTMARKLGLGPSRVQLQNKNPRAWATFVRQLAEHSAEGSALTVLGVQR